MKWSEEELNAYDDAFVRATDNQTLIELALDEGEKKVLEKGKKELAIARQLLSELSPQKIAQITGLAVEEIQKLKHDRTR